MSTSDYRPENRPLHPRPLGLRLGAIVLLVMGALGALGPTVFPSWEGPRLHLGVDLQGGMAIVLDVRHERLWRDEVEDDAVFLQRRPDAVGLGLTEARAVGSSTLVLRADAPADRVDAFVARNLGSYERVDASDRQYTYALTAARKAALRETAMTRVITTIERRTACWSGPTTIERLGAGLVALRVLGLDDPRMCL